jgi:FKBP-type peptidyl-prolyl cis-trans isomerase SlpA
MASSAPRIQHGSFITLHYRLAGPQGDIINTFADKPATLTLGTGELSPVVEQRLIGLEEGARASFEIAAGLAFGERNPEMVQWVARTLLARMGDR